MPIYEIVIPDYLPPSVNQLTKGWHRAHRLKKECRAMVAYYANHLTRARIKRRVSLTLTLAPRNRKMDPDNVWKAVLDALVSCCLLMDDSQPWCEIGTVAFERGAERETRITLEDVE